ncbi:putative adenylyltransferase/sulfurtransferase MoeZ [Saezia sanguinis]|uniref:Putative adenylyltransferase/sulfurtransferase MoeZ n=1 Tax=Saezia sanguinis TaxID=1965230 RepID=A0A433SFI0_9BURK|nr:putative adenylyltransferase/sulfurtransferase MoeZ [Saezia sanguinis]
MIKNAQTLVAEAKKNIHEITVNEADAALKAADIIIDVREPAEYQAGHVPGAVNIPRGLLEFKLGEIPELNSAQARIVMYCKTDGRCALAAQTLQDMGYQQVQSIAGGINAWIDAGKPIEL